jgi:hypothetical protein
MDANELDIIRQNYTVYGTTELKNTVQKLLKLIDELNAELNAAAQYAEDNT